MLRTNQSKITRSQPYYSTAQIYVNCADAFYTHIRVWLYAHTRIVIRICTRMFIRTNAYSYTHIRVYVYAYIRIYMLVWCDFVIQDENSSLCFIVVKEKESKKATSRRRKINISHKVNGDHVTNTDIASLHVFIGWREEAVHLPYLLLLMNQNEKKNVT